MIQKIEARVSHRFRSAAESVYDAWLDPALVGEWLPCALREMGLAGDIRAIEIDPRTGGRFLFADQRGDVEARHWGTYLEVDRPRKIAFTWIVDAQEEADPSRVTLTIEPDPDGCVATLVHEIDAVWAEYLAQTERGWYILLQAAGKHAEAHRPTL